jgi:hypothetical protein
MTVKKASPVLWILVPLSLALALAATWGTFHFGPTGSKAYIEQQCESLKTFIIDEETAGKADWTIYKSQVGKYLQLDPATNRTETVDSIVTSVIKVLEHDLKIYERLDKYPACLLPSRKDELPTLLDETRNAIDYLSGTFSSAEGEWNTDFYSDYISAAQYLKGANESADAASRS